MEALAIARGGDAARSPPKSAPEAKRIILVLHPMESITLATTPGEGGDPAGERGPAMDRIAACAVAFPAPPFDVTNHPSQVNMTPRKKARPRHAPRGNRHPGRATASAPRRKRVFAIVLALVPFVLIGLVEGGLRLAGFGGYPPVIEDVGVFHGQHWYTTNRAGTDTFFSSGQARTGGMRVIHFVTPKPPGTVRIAILGGSAAQGFPQPLPLTNGAFLQAFLQQIWGNSRKVQVLNFGATAVASFPVMRFLDEVIEQDPDLVIVMSGNNEFYGAYGMASLAPPVRSPAGMRALRWLGSLAITQGLNRLLATLHSGESSTGKSLMEIMGVKREVGPSSGARRAAARSLQANLTSMVRRCNQAKVPIIVCTVPTNERDMAPIGAAEASSEELAALGKAGGFIEIDPAKAEGMVREMLKKDDQLALAHYTLASALTRLGQDQEAHEQYVQARDLDPMPWRANSAARGAILAAGREGAVLCDMENAFRAASPGGSIGWELMDDHVHMSLAGQALFAKTVLRTLSGFAGPLHVDSLKVDALGDWPAWAARMGRCTYTDYVASARARSLLGISFMRRNNEAAYRRWDHVCETELASMSALDHKALERWRDPELHGATERPLTYVVGAYRFQQGDYATAERLFRVAMATVPTVSSWRLQLTWYILLCRRHLADEPGPEDIRLCGETITVGEMLKQFGHAKERDVLRYLGLAYNMAGEYQSAVENLRAAIDGAPGGADTWEAVAALVDSYVQTGRVADARALLQRAAQDPGMADRARRLLTSLPGASRSNDR